MTKFAWPDEINTVGALCILSSEPSHAWGPRPPTPGQTCAWWSEWHTKSYASSKEPFIFNCFVLYLKQLLLLPPNAFYLVILNTKEVTKSTPLKCVRPNFCFAQHKEIIIINHHNFFINCVFCLQMRDVADVESSSSIFFTLHVPRHITRLPWITKFPLKHQVLVPSRPTYMGSGLKQ